jgi:hypothetical protein
MILNGPMDGLDVHATVGEDGDEVVLQNTVHLQFLDARLSSNNIPDTQKKKFLSRAPL